MQVVVLAFTVIGVVIGWKKMIVTGDFLHPFWWAIIGAIVGRVISAIAEIPEITGDDVEKVTTIPSTVQDKD